MKGKALRRALASSDSVRINAPVPLIVDTTELITPDIAREMLRRNRANRPINWNKVEEYAAIMVKGEWRLHGQGVLLDADGNILTGQKRLWAVIYSGCSVYMRVSRGNPSDVGRLLDRGTPQSSRDLASRGTNRKHSPVEASIARGVCALRGDVHPSVNLLAEAIERNADIVASLLEETRGVKKTRSMLMVLSAIVAVVSGPNEVRPLAGSIEELSRRLDIALAPQTAAVCWGKSAAFSLAMEHARRVVLAEAM